GFGFNQRELKLASACLLVFLQQADQVFDVHFQTRQTTRDVNIEQDGLFQVRDQTATALRQREAFILRSVPALVAADGKNVDHDCNRDDHNQIQAGLSGNS